MSALSTLPLRAARWSATHPWRAIACWLVFVVAAIALSVLVPTQATTDDDYRIGDSGRAAALFDAGGFQGPDVERVLITPAPGTELSPGSVDAAVHDLTRDMSGLAEVTRVVPGVWNPDHSAMLVDVHLEDGTDDVAALQAVTERVQDAHPALRLRQAGDVSTDAAINDRVAQDLSSAEAISLPVTLILMLLAFGALIAAGVPVLLAVTSVGATMGIAAPLSHLIHAEPTVSSMIVLIGMAVGVDYSLFYLKREREERAKGRDRIDAVEVAAATSGHSILVSGAAVIACMAGLYVVGSATFDSLATGAIVVVGVAVLGSLTVLPAVLAKLGRWADRPRIPLLWRANRRIGHGGISRRILAPVLRRPLVALLSATAVLGLLAVPALGLTVHSANLQTLPQSIPEVATLNRLAREFPSQGTTVQVVVRADADQRQEVGAALARLDRSAIATGDFTDLGQDPVQVSRDGTVSVLELATPYAESDPRTDTAVETVRTTLAPETLGALDAAYAVGGDAAESLDFADRQSERMPLVIGIVLLLTLLMMGFSFRSVPIALLSTGLNLLSVGVAFGILRLVFQDGWFSGSLGFASPGFVIDWIPLFVMVILVGLSMDYHVFVISRIREQVLRGVPARIAVRNGIVDTAGVVTSAAAVMVSVFAIFASLSMLEMKMMGVGLAAAILIDATLIRLVILPAALVLMGDRAWWPTLPRRPVGEVVREPEPEPELVASL